MALQYSNFKKFLTENNYRVLCSLEEFCDSKLIIFECSKKHKSEIKNTSFVNKKTKFKENPGKLCSNCLYYDEEGERFQTLSKKIYDQTGHKLLSIEKERKVKYQCGNCDQENSSFLGNLEKNLGTCPYCQNNKFKNEVEDVKKEIEKYCTDHKIVYYKNCKDLLLICPKNHEYTTTLHLFKSGRRCPACAPEKRKKTVIEKYGVDNVSKSENVKEKIVNTMQERFGVPYAMQNPHIFSKQLSTSFNTKDFIFPSGRVEKIRGYEDICILELLKTYKEDEIIIDPLKIPVISYNKILNNVEKKSKYFPDILLPDKIIEVKSIFTFERHKENNERKFKACAESGYNIEVWIYNRNKQVIDKKIYNKKG